MTIPNELTLRDRRIVGIGGAGVTAADASSQPDLVTTPAFDAAAFDPDVAIAMTRWAFTQALNRPGIGWRHRFALPNLDIEWPAWGSIPLDRRRTYLTAYRRFRVDVNGRPAIRPRVDVPLLRGAFGTKVDPGP
jgi:hypothetical protein